MTNPLEQEIKTELCSEIEAAEKNYVIIKEILSGVHYEDSDVRGTLQSFKDNLSKVSSLFMALAQFSSKDTKSTQIPVDSFLWGIDFVLIMMDTPTQKNVCSLLQLAFSASSVKIENVMALLSILKKTLYYDKQTK